MSEAPVYRGGRLRAAGEMGTEEYDYVMHGKIFEDKLDDQEENL